MKRIVAVTDAKRVMIPPMVLLVLIPSKGFEKASNPALFLGLAIGDRTIVFGVMYRRSRGICCVSTTVNLNCMILKMLLLLFMCFLVSDTYRTEYAVG